MDELDRQKLIEDHLEFAGQVASTTAKLCPFDARQELKQAGIVGLVEAAYRFDPAQGATFKTYAAQRIRGAVLDAMRASDLLNRSERRAVRDGGAWDPGQVRSLDKIPRTSELVVHPLIDSTHREGTTDDRWASVARAIRRLGKNERRCLVLIYGHGLNLKETGAQLHLSESRVCRLRTGAIRKIQRALEGVP